MDKGGGAGGVVATGSERDGGGRRMTESASGAGRCIPWAPACTEEMLLKMMKIYMDKGGGSGRGKGNLIGAGPGGRRISPDARFRGDVSRAARLSARISSPT